MTKKLKSGFILFLFVITTYIALVNPLGRYFDFHGEEGLIMLFIIFGALFLSLAFSFLLAKIQRRIEENIFSYGWLIKSNLLIALLFYVALIIFSVALVFISIQFFNAQSESFLLVLMVLFYGLWIAPLSTFIFNFIPSLFSSKFHSNNNLLKIIAIIFIVLSLISISYFVARNVTCEFKDDYICVADKAIATQNPQLCGEIKENYMLQDLCYGHVSVQTDDVSLCAKITDDITQSRCITYIAMNMNDSKICDGVKSKNEIFNKESCYNFVLLHERDTYDEPF